jgi:hypothetical protein
MDMLAASRSRRTMRCAAGAMECRRAAAVVVAVPVTEPDPERSIRDILGPDVADRVAALIKEDLDNGLAERMAASLAVIFEIRRLIAEAPPHERPALVAHVKAHIAARRAELEDERARRR